MTWTLHGLVTLDCVAALTVAPVLHTTGERAANLTADPRKIFWCRADGPLSLVARVMTEQAIEVS